MAEDGRPKWALFDEAKLRLVREFLRREFRGCDHRDYAAFDPVAQVFIMETERGVRHTLIIPQATFAAANFGALCNVQLADALELARGGCVTLTREGPDVRP